LLTSRNLEQLQWQKKDYKYEPKQRTTNFCTDFFQNLGTNVVSTRGFTTVKTHTYYFLYFTGIDWFTKHTTSSWLEWLRTVLR